jgi:hypothetical protein
MSSKATPPATMAAESSTGATCSPRYASGRLPAWARKLLQTRRCRSQLTNGKFAIVEKSHEFTLVPWRPVIDRQLGREVMGVVQGSSVPWQLGRQRAIGL